MQIKFTNKLSRVVMLYGNFLAFFMLIAIGINAQTTITTSGATYDGGNGVTGASAITFGLQNGNGDTRQLNQINVFWNAAITSGSTTATLWYTTTSLSGAPTIASPAWTQLATTSVNVTASGIIPTFIGLTFMLMANTQYRFAVQSTNGIAYSGSGAVPATPVLFSADGVNLQTAGFQISAANVGYGGGFPSPTFNPRAFTGSIIFTNTNPPCTGTPAPGNTIASTTTVCPAIPFNLSVQNQTTGLGVTYQWQTATAVGGPYTNVTGATSSTLTTSQSVATYYRLQVTCSGNTTASTPVLVAKTPDASCYCPASSTDINTFFEKIANVTFGALNNSSTSFAGYEDFTGLTPVASFAAGSFNTLTITGNANIYSGDRVNVWIDYNQNGNFTDPGEQVFASAASAGPYTTSITIPVTATVGNTRMRIRLYDGTFGNGVTGPCGDNTYGQVEDYTINITPCVPVSVTSQPVNRTIQCGQSTTFSLAATGSGITYLWQQRDNATLQWNNLTNGGVYSGATTNTLTVTNAPQSLSGSQYRVIYTGGCSGSEFSSIVTLTVSQLVTTVTPTSAAICLGSVQQLSLTNTVSAVQTSTFNATGLPVAIPDGTFPVTTATAIPITISGIPAGSIVQNIGVRFTMTHGYVGDIVMNLNAPNGQNLNLFTLLDNATGTNSSANFTNTTIDSVSTANISGAAAPRSGSYHAERYAITNPNFGDLVVTNKSWVALLGTLNGTWNIKVADLGAPDAGTVTALSLFITYTAPNFAQGVWTPDSTLFTNAAATIPYLAGSLASTVYAKPIAAGLNNYKVSFATATCQSSVATIPVVVSRPITGTSTATNKSVCVGGTTSFTASAPTSGDTIRHQWKVSTDAGVTFTNVTNGGVYSGATTGTLTITGATASLNGNRYKDSLYVPACSSTIFSSTATLTVNPVPVITVSVANSLSAIYPGQIATLTASVSPNAAATYVWLRNGEVVAGATGATLPVTVDQLGSYTVRVTDVNGCVSTSAATVISAAANDILFIYPSPNNGQFQVRFYSNSASSGPRTINIYDSKGSKVYSKAYSLVAPYTRENVDLSSYGKGIYSVEVIDGIGKRVKTGRVLVL